MTKTTIFTATALVLTFAVAVPAAANTGWAAVATRYESIRQALVGDSLARASAEAGALRAELAALRKNLTAERAGVAADSLAEVEKLLPEAAAAARELEDAQDLPAARDAFYALTKPLVRWRQAAGSGPGVAYCPMEKRSWLQPTDAEMGNPYLGKEMPACGEIVGGN